MFLHWKSYIISCQRDKKFRYFQRVIFWGNWKRWQIISNSPWDSVHVKHTFRRLKHRINNVVRGTWDDTKTVLPHALRDLLWKTGKQAPSHVPFSELLLFWRTVVISALDLWSFIFKLCENPTKVAFRTKKLSERYRSREENVRTMSYTSNMRMQNSEWSSDHNPCGIYHMSIKLYFRIILFRIQFLNSDYIE